MCIREPRTLLGVVVVLLRKKTLRLLYLFFQFLGLLNQFFSAYLPFFFERERPLVGIEDSFWIEDLGEEIERELVIPGPFQFAMGL